MSVLTTIGAHQDSEFESWERNCDSTGTCLIAQIDPSRRANAPAGGLGSGL